MIVGTQWVVYLHFNDIFIEYLPPYEEDRQTSMRVMLSSTPCC